MITARPADERGHADHGWLDPVHVHWGPLRVITCRMCVEPDRKGT
jgi:hypothetical protein